MDRDYKTGKSDSVGIFSGFEVEHTPAFGKKTLFLARNDLLFDQIVDLAQEVNAEAIYFGANRSFMHNIVNTPQLIKRLMDKGYWCTIDYQYSVHKDVKQNLCIKVDDVDFNKTNPGVWTMTMDHYKQSSGYTSWEEYKQDEPLEVENA